MTFLKVTATHKTEHIRIALVATPDNAEQRATQLRAAGYWENVKIESFEGRKIRVTR